MPYLQHDPEEQRQRASRTYFLTHLKNEEPEAGPEVPKPFPQPWGTILLVLLAAGMVGAAGAAVYGVVRVYVPQLPPIPGLPWTQ
jgi:hypothetical protein